MRRLPDAQQKVYRFIVKQVGLKGIPPSIREIMDEFGYTSTNAVRLILEALRKKGFIAQQQKGLSRQITPVFASVGLKIPIVGRVAAGMPIYAEERGEGYLHFGEDSDLSSNSFIVIVRDNSLVGIGIELGDYVLVEPDSELNVDDIVVIRYGDEIILRKLEPESIICVESREGLVEDTETVEYEVCGKVVRLLRKY